MRYIKEGELLRWFQGRSKGTTVYKKPQEQGIVYDVNWNDAPSVIDAVGRIILDSTGDYDFTTEVVENLANAMHVKRQLRR